MEHYYTKNPQIAHDTRKIDFNIRDIKLQFITDAGVFSKSGVDYGSCVMLNTLPKINGDVLDLGCGYGAIGIAIAKLNPMCRVTMIDINERAVELTEKNILLNKVENAECFQSDAFENVKGVYDVIVCNPPIRTGKKVIYPMFENSIKYLNSDGSLYIVIQKKQGANSAIEKLQETYGNCEAINKDAGYWILKCQVRDK
jgi:16S rRNA (guanine1207-N2)-methyltransferase